MDVTPLEECLEAAGAIVKRCGGRGKMKGMLKTSSDKDEIDGMKAYIRDLEADLSLAGVAILEGKTSDLRAVLERMGKSQAAEEMIHTETIIDRPSMTPAKLAKIPKGTPIRKSWHVERLHVVERVFEALTTDGGPRLVGLVGASGSGKTTAASEIVRSDEVRQAFSDGVLWLTVNDGAKDRLPSLMLQLAHMVYEEVGGPPPARSEYSATYVNEQMKRGHGGKGLKCLVVADNVWEKEVVWNLLETGMWVLLSTRDEELMKGSDGEVVVVDEMSEVEAESVLSKAAELPPEVRLPDEAVDLVELCGRVAMDLAFVGHWSTVRGRLDRTAWSDAVGKVRAEMGKIEDECISGTVVETRDARRKAVLHAGFEDLGVGSDGERLQWLYLSLAVLPVGYEFNAKEAAVLLCDRTPSAEDEVSAPGVVKILERWSVLRPTGRSYCVHDAHSVFARKNLMDHGDVRRRVLARWTRYVSSLDTLPPPTFRSSLWEAVAQAGGEEYKMTHSYESALSKMEDSDPDLSRPEEVVARCQQEQPAHGDEDRHGPPADAALSPGLDDDMPSPYEAPLTTREATLTTSLGPGPVTYVSKAHAVEFELQAGSLNEELPLQMGITRGLAFVDCRTEGSGSYGAPFYGNDSTEELLVMTFVHGPEGVNFPDDKPAKLRFFLGYVDDLAPSGEDSSDRVVITDEEIERDIQEAYRPLSSPDGVGSRTTLGPYLVVFRRLLGQREVWVETPVYHFSTIANSKKRPARASSMPN